MSYSLCDKREVVDLFGLGSGDFFEIDGYVYSVYKYNDQDRVLEVFDWTRKRVDSFANNHPVFRIHANIYVDRPGQNP